MTTFERQILKRYRTINTWSRAIKLYTLYGSGGTQRRATCIFCRKVVATCSNQWPETQTFRKNAYKHSKQCAILWWCDGQVLDLKEQLKINEYIIS